MTARSTVVPAVALRILERLAPADLRRYTSGSLRRRLTCATKASQFGAWAAEMRW